MPTELIPLGKLKGLDSQYGEPRVYLCTEFEGNPKCKSPEMEDPFWIGSDDIPDNLFQPFEESILMLENADISTNILENNFTNNGENDIIKLGIRDDSDQWLSTETGSHFKVNEQNEITAGFGDKFHHKTPGQAFGKGITGGAGGRSKTHENKNTRVTEQQRKTIDGVIKGSETKNGAEIKTIDEHAYERMDERGYGPSQIKYIYQTYDSKKGKKGRTLYEDGKVRVVINEKIGMMISIVRLDKPKRRSKKK